MSESLVEGWTEPISYQLFIDGLALSLTGKTINIVMYNGFGKALTPSGVVSVVDTDLGKISYTPAAGELTFANSPYQIRWRVTEGAQIAYFPREDPELWVVRKP